MVLAQIYILVLTQNTSTAVILQLLKQKDKPHVVQPTKYTNQPSIRPSATTHGSSLDNTDQFQGRQLKTNLISHMYCNSHEDHTEGVGGAELTVDVVWHVLVVLLVLCLYASDLSGR